MANFAYPVNTVADAVTNFAKANYRRNFHLAELRKYVRECGFGVQRDTPVRTLRALRSNGVINYRVVSAEDSLYRIIPNSAR
jgi:hypothetical protein